MPFFKRIGCFDSEEKQSKGIFYKESIFFDISRWFERNGSFTS
jgi:hypothetical protein